MQPCNCTPVAQADTAYHLLNHYGFKLSINSIRDEMAIWAQQDEVFLRPGLCNVAVKYSKTYEQLIADALKIDAPASDVTFFIISRMRGKTIRIICSMQEGWLTHYSNNWDELDAILVWTGYGDFEACEPMMRHLYQEDIGPYAMPFADPGQPTFAFPHLQQLPQDLQQLITMYAAISDPQAVQPITMSRKRQLSLGQGTQQVAKKHTLAIQKAKKAITAAQFGAKLLSTHKPVKKATQSQTQTMTPEVQQLIADLIMRGPDMPHTKKSTAVTSTGQLTMATSTTKITTSMSTGTQLHQKAAMVTIPDPSQIISINDDEPTLTTDATPMVMSVLDTAMMEDDESMRTKQFHLMQESINKLLQGHRSEQDLQEKIAKLTSK